MTVTFELDGLHAAIRDHFSRVADDAVQDMLVDMANDAPRRDGTMTNTLEVDTADTDTSAIRTVRAPAEWSSWQDEGTGEYIGEGRIYPRTAKALRFVAADGSVVIVKSVKGTPPTHWFSGKIAKWSDYLAARLG